MKLSLIIQLDLRHLQIVQHVCKHLLHIGCVTFVCLQFFVENSNFASHSRDFLVGVCY